MVIRSFRRVFELERRIYRIDRLRLNPGGVPVRSLVYFLALVLACVLVARLPVLGYPLALAPWYLRDLVLPGIGAATLAAFRVDGRAGHLAVHAIVRFWLGPRYLIAGRPRAQPQAHWLPPDVVVFPDGAEGTLRRMRYAGPGAAVVALEHRRALTLRARPLIPARALVTVRASAPARRPRARRLVVLPAASARLELKTSAGVQED